MTTTSTSKSSAGKRRFTFSMTDEKKAALRDVAAQRFAGNESAALEFAVDVLTVLMADASVRGQTTATDALQTFVALHKGK